MDGSCRNGEVDFRSSLRIRIHKLMVPVKQFFDLARSPVCCSLAGPVRAAAQASLLAFWGRLRGVASLRARADPGILGCFLLSPFIDLLLTDKGRQDRACRSHESKGKEKSLIGIEEVNDLPGYGCGNDS